VSGGEDDTAYVWKVENGEVVFECGNHRDSVTHAQFSHDGVYVATADMAGFIQVWKMATKAVVWSFEMGDLSVCVYSTYILVKLFHTNLILFQWLDWHSGSHVLFAGALDGATWMWKIPSGDCKTFPGYGERNECGKLLPDGKYPLNQYKIRY
jgi:angio-associated migratory cell protein